MSTPLPLLILAVAASAPAGMGQELFTLEGDMIRWVDPQSSAVLRTGYALGAQGAWTGLARDSQGRFFGSSGYTWLPYGIYEIDPATGATQFVCQTSLLGLHDLEFGPGGQLYGINNPLAGRIGGVMDLVQIDLATGQHVIVGSTGFQALNSLGYHDGYFWSYDSNVIGHGLVRLDPLTGAGTDVSPGFRGPTDLLDTICFSDDGVAYLVNFGLWIMDLDTGVPVLVNPIASFPLVDAAEFVPANARPFSLGARGQTGGLMSAFVAGATPGATIALLQARGGGPGMTIGAGRICAGTSLNLGATAQLAALLVAGPDGAADSPTLLAPPLAPDQIWLQALDLTTCAVSNHARILY